MCKNTYRCSHCAEEGAKIVEYIACDPIDFCPQCGEEVFSIHRNPWSDIACENNHRWKWRNVIIREQKEDGRWHVVKIKIKYTLVEQENKNG